MKSFLKRHLAKLALGGFVLSAVGVAALAQNSGQVLTTLLGTEYVQVQSVTNSTAAITYATVSEMRNSRGWVYETPLTGVTLVMNGNQSLVSINPAGTIAAHTVTLPPSPPDGTTVQIFSSQIITTLTINTSDSSTFAPTAVTTLGANGSVEYVYSVAGTVWHRVT